MTALLECVDESIRSGRYLLGAVVVDALEAGRLRRSVRKLLLPGQRKLHLKTEGNRPTRALIDLLGRLEVEAIVYSCLLSNDIDAEAARSRCLSALVREMQSRDRQSELLIESRQQLDALDGGTIRRARRPESLLSFQHQLPDHDPLLWPPDSFAWAIGAGGDWLRRVGRFVTVVEVG